MIELGEQLNENYYQVIIDGRVCENSYYDGKKEYFANDNQDSIKFASKSFQEFMPFSYIRLKNLFEWTDLASIVGISQENGEDEVTDKHISVEIIFQPNLMNWEKTYTYLEYIELFIEIWESDNGVNEILHFDNDDLDDIGYWLSIESLLPKGTINDFIFPFAIELRRIHEKTLHILNSELGSKIFFTFNFPEKLKIPCEQYLLYFAQFLQDLGINATSNLKEEAGNVLFSVTPTDNVEALDKIRESLAVYLNLPSSPIIFDDSFAAMRLQQQIENLQHSQRMAVRELQFNEKLLVAQSEIIQEKNVTISQQQTVISQKDKIIEKLSSKSIMIDSVENKEEFEKIFDGLEVGESKELKEKLGIKFNPATSLKTIGKSILGKDEIIELGLDKDG